MAFEFEEHGFFMGHSRIGIDDRAFAEATGIRFTDPVPAGVFDQVDALHERQ